MQMDMPMEWQTLKKGLGYRGPKLYSEAFQLFLMKRREFGGNHGARGFDQLGNFEGGNLNSSALEGIHSSGGFVICRDLSPRLLKRNRNVTVNRSTKSNYLQTCKRISHKNNHP